MSAAEVDVMADTLQETTQPTDTAKNGALCNDARNRTPSRKPRLVTQSIAGVRTGTLIGFSDEGHTPLVTFPDQPGAAAIAAGAVLDLNGNHIGRNVVLMFENGDPGRPIVMGLLRTQQPWPLGEQPGQVQVDADGQRLTVSAKEQLVLKCGKASVTLTKAGKILIEGTYVSNRSSGVMRIKGGSVQLN